MKNRNTILLIVGVVAIGAIGYAVYKSIKNAQDSKGE